MVAPRKLSTKLVAIQVFVLAVALVSIGLTLAVSWRLEGSAAAINDAGSLRMRTYRLAWLTEAGPGAAVEAASLARDVAEFTRVLTTLRQGDPARPLAIPGTPDVERRLAAVEAQWTALASAFSRVAEGGALHVSHADIDRFVGDVNDLVATIERESSRTEQLLGRIQLALLVLAIAGALALIYLSFVFIVHPVASLEGGLRRLAQGDLATRLPVESSDEFGALARGFNYMAAKLEESYGMLETRVAEKTSSLAEQNARLHTLYDMTAFLNAPNSQEELCRGFLRRLRVTTGATAGLVRLTSRDGATLHVFVEEGLSREFIAKEHCLARGECACGDAAVRSAAVVHAFGQRRVPISVTLPHCREAGYGSVAAFPIAAQQQVLGVYTLFFRESRELGSEERHMLESLGQHLGVSIESLRLASSDRELAVAQERNLLAQELHDSIAQSLAFLNLQVQMLRRSLAGASHDEAARTVDEIQTGVQECYADVRELLTHFRMRAGEGDLEHGIRTLLARFERQTGVATRLEVSGTGVPLDPDRQLQVMHIAHEALSNVRKHALARNVAVTIHNAGGTAIAVRDDGRGFEPEGAAPDPADHVGLRIMHERAARIGATLAVRSGPGRGTEVALAIPAIPAAAANGEGSERAAAVSA